MLVTKKTLQKNSPDFIKQVAAASAMECFGVVAMARKNESELIVEMLSSKNFIRGVKVDFGRDGRAQIDLYVIIVYGVKIMTVAENLIDTVKYNVEKQTDIKVKKINVYVQSIRI